MQHVTASRRPDSRSAEVAPARPGSGEMFDSIAGRYDLLNRIMSFRLDRRWRSRAVAALGAGPRWRVLDLATGTADVALEVLRQVPDAKVVGLDPSPRMLDVGKRKVEAAGLGHRIELRPGTAETLPFADDSFDAATIAWGIRNVPDRPAALAEMARVVREDGRIAILESTEPRSGILAPFARAYVRHVVPRLGAWLSRERAYKYLQTSIEAFPTPAEFARMMAASGLEVTEVYAHFHRCRTA